MRHALIEVQLERYREDGYLNFPQPVFSPERFERLKGLEGSKFAEHAEKAGGVAPSLIDCPHWSDPRLFEWLLAEEMLALAEPLLGPDIAIFREKNPNFQIYLARGQDRAGNHYSDPSRVYPPAGVIV